MKTQVRITSDIPQERATKGDFGYIDGYVHAGDNRPYAVVVIRDFICLVPMYAIEVLKSKVY